MTRWPATMKRKTAAEYLDMSEGAFVREVAAGRLPAAVMLGGREHWPKASLDRVIARMAGDDPKPEYLEDFESRYGPQAA